jgi:ectoine hydroxylase-related dioxygenase (phytanoyl-CoA dioxygenase family)
MIASVTRVIEYVGMTATPAQQQIDGVLEDVAVRGYAIVADALAADECRRWAEKLDRLNRLQNEQYGAARLAELGEGGTLRGMLYADADFLSLVRHPATWPIVERVIGSAAILHLQNGILVEPQVEHHQSAFHRDFAKDFVADKPLSLNALFAIDDFTTETGGTWWVPYTHRSATFPSLRYLEANAIQIDVRAGSAVFFDSLLVHRAGENRSSAPRRAINHQYTRPFIKQQMDYPTLLRDAVDPESPLAQTLGFWSVPPRSVDEFRVDPERRTYRRGQG